MRIKAIGIEKNRPITADLIMVTYEDGSTYHITDENITDLLIEEDLICADCRGEGTLEEGQFDDITTRKCKCQYTEPEPERDED